MVLSFTFKFNVRRYNKATQDVIMQVALRSFVLVKGINIGTATYSGANFTTNFRTAQADAFAATAQTNWVFRGVKDVQLLNPTADADTSLTSFDLKITYFEMPDGRGLTLVRFSAQPEPNLFR
jgi:hypothetical protein